MISVWDKASGGTGNRRRWSQQVARTAENRKPRWRSQSARRAGIRKGALAASRSGVEPLSARAHHHVSGGNRALAATAKRRWRPQPMGRNRAAHP